MGFMRRKSVAATDAEEVRPRNRLTKPMTSKPSSEQRSPSGKKIQTPPSRSATGSISSRSALDDVPGSLVKRDSRDLIKQQLLGNGPEPPSRSPMREVPKKSGVASLVMQFENAASTSQQPSMPQTVPSNPLMSNYGSLRLNGVQQRMQDILAQDQTRSLKRSSPVSPSPTASLEKLIDPFAIPRRRESTYRPGEATRKPSIEEKENQPPLREELSSVDINKPLPYIQDEGVSESSDREWTPPPSVPRVDTPASLEPRAIGNLRLGSLRVVNGRSSPMHGELSRPAISKQLRDVSSEYADSVYSKDLGSETWEDDRVVDEEDHRSDTHDNDKPLEGIYESSPTDVRDPTPVPETQSVASPQIPHTPRRGHSMDSRASVQSPDRTSIMAQSYIVELQGSPFSLGTVSPRSTHSVIHHEPVAAEQEEEDVLSDASIESEQPSVLSKPSVAGTVSTRDQAFSSALEYQAPHFEPPPSPERGYSPESTRSNFVDQACARVDSGYNSGNSMISFHGEDLQEASRTTKVVQHNTKQHPLASEGEDRKGATAKKESSPRKLGRFFPIRPNTRGAAATEVVPQAVKPFRPQSFVGQNPVAPIIKPIESTKKSKAKEELSTKAQKKLVKSRAQSKSRDAQEIVVQRLASCESTLSLPAITAAAEANLKRRSLLVPELEKTYVTQDHIKNHPSMSSLALPVADIRFPSPLPESHDDDRHSRMSRRDKSRSKSRPRSKSRRRSFLDMFRSDKDSGKRPADQDKQDAEVSIADFGDVMTSLGANPYDIAHSRPQTPSQSLRSPEVRRTNPHDISVNRPQKRLSMNDAEASDFARRRSHSFGHGERAEHKVSLNPRGGLPGNLLRFSPNHEEVPPIPPMPNDKELRRISQRHSIYSPLSMPTENSITSHNEPFYAEQRSESSPAPPPPTHSPRPQQTYPHYEDSRHSEWDPDFAPPPPSHSPIPMEISDSRTNSRSADVIYNNGGREAGNVWGGSARAWEERRKAASEALRSHRRSQSPYDYHQDYEHDGPIQSYNDAEYPVVPHGYARQNRLSQQDEGYWLANNEAHEDYDYQELPQRSRTWDDRPQFSDQSRYYQEYDHTQPQYTPRRHQTWDQGQSYNRSRSPYEQSHEETYSGPQSYHRSTTNDGSRQSFYSHQNLNIDRPFDPPPQMIDEYDDEYGQYDYPPQPYPSRGRERHREEYDYSQPNGYEKSYPQPYQYEDTRQAYNPSQHYQSYDHPAPIQRKPLPQYFQQRQQQHPTSRSRSRSPRPSLSPVRSHQSSSISPPTPSISRRSSRHSIRSNISSVSLADELHPEINKRPSPAPDYGRYSGGMGFGYEGRERGFGGSAGTRSVSGKAEGIVKGVRLREGYGVDLGDVPVIGVVRPIR